MPEKDRKFSSIISRGDIEYFDTFVFKKITCFNVLGLIAVSVICFIPAPILFSDFFSEAVKSGQFGLQLLAGRYHALEVRAPGQGLSFIVSNIFLQILSLYSIFAISFRFKKYKMSLNIALNFHNLVSFAFFIALILVSIYIIFYLDVDKEKIFKEYSYYALNSPFIFVLLVGFYSVIIEFFVQIFALFAIIKTHKDSANG